jgi:hypothetical protein
MSAKLTASADGTKVLLGTAAENALQIDSTAKTIEGINGYELASDKVAKTGDTMTGPLIVPDATAAKEAMNRDAADARYVNVSGDTMTGELLVPKVTAAERFDVNHPTRPSGFKRSSLAPLINGTVVGAVDDAGATFTSAIRFSITDGICPSGPIIDHDSGGGQTPIIQIVRKASVPAVNHFINSKAQAFWSYLNETPGNTDGIIGFATTLAAGGFSSWLLQCDRAGNVIVNGNLTPNASDARLKDNKVAISNPMERLSKITGYDFVWKEGGPQPSTGADTGLLAQEVQQVFPQIVSRAGFDCDEKGESKSGENYLSIQLGHQITALLVEAVKELSAKVAALEARMGP